MITKTSKYFLWVFTCLTFSLFGQFVQAENLPKVLLAPDAYAMQQAGELEIFDIRTPTEWHNTGVTKGAKLVTMHQPDGPLAFLEAMKLSVKGDMDKPIAVICATGNRSGWAQSFLSDNGFNNITSISEGMMGRGNLPGWLARKLPTTQP